MTESSVMRRHCVEVTGSQHRSRDWTSMKPPAPTTAPMAFASSSCSGVGWAVPIRNDSLDAAVGAFSTSSWQPHRSTHCMIAADVTRISSERKGAVLTLIRRALRARTRSSEDAKTAIMPMWWFWSTLWRRSSQQKKAAATMPGRGTRATTRELASNARTKDAAAIPPTSLGSSVTNRMVGARASPRPSLATIELPRRRCARSR
mmetsp:Transcript_25623/g.82519  ORF Transcript_25623/g.82519 Transcript_25623/m.82519 type:complete len:204 (-) Transcript_25623:312-923(-)